MSRNIALLWAILSLSILPLSYAQDKSAGPAANKSSAPAEDKSSVFDMEKAGQPVKKKDVKKSKRWYPFEKNKKWYPFIGQSGDQKWDQQKAGQQLTGQQQKTQPR